MPESKKDKLIARYIRDLRFANTDEEKHAVLARMYMECIHIGMNS